MAMLKAEDLELVVDDEEALDVLDLPQLHSRPSAKTILTTLADLVSEPPSWDHTPKSGALRSPLSGVSTPLRRKRKVKSEGLPGYLTKIISSPLAWLNDEGEKEAIWETASLRLSERSGRTGMGALSRTFTIPLSALPVGTSAAVEYGGGDVVEIVLHEPALTSDNLGLKTWASSYLLAKRLALLRDTLAPALQQAANHERQSPLSARILELGAGTGLVGLAAAFILQAPVLLTDLPPIVPNLEKNARANTMLPHPLHGEVSVGILDWSHPTTLTIPNETPMELPLASFPIILAADPVYDLQHAILLPDTVAKLLSCGKDARLVVEMPLREGFVAEQELLKQNLRRLGLVVRSEGEEEGLDDWGSGDEVGDERKGLIKCWWSVWGWG